MTTKGAKYAIKAIVLLLVLAAALSLYPLCSFALELDYTDKSFAKQFLTIINNERQSRGLNPVTLDFFMCIPAKQRAIECSYNDMSSAETAHTRPDGRYFGTIFQEFGITGFSKGMENLVFTNEVNLSAQNIFNAWMNSTTGHREAMLNEDITVIGIGYYKSDPGITVAGKVYPDGCLFSCLLMTVSYTATDPYTPASASSSPTASQSPAPSPSVTPSASPDESATPYMWQTPAPSGEITPVPTITPIPSVSPTPTKRPTPTPQTWTTAAPWATVAPWEWNTLDQPGVVEYDNDYWENRWLLPNSTPNFDGGSAIFPETYVYAPPKYKKQMPSSLQYGDSKWFECTK